MNSPLLETVPRGYLLRNAVVGMCRPAPHRPLWTMVKDLTGFGSTSATKLCRELDWDPDCKPSLLTVHRLTVLK